MEVSPLLASDTAGSIEAAVRIHEQADRPNLFVKIPGTPAGIPAIEESIFGGVPINVTLLFSREQYHAAAEAYLRGIERRIAAGRDPRVASVASLFVSRWDKAVSETVPAALRNTLGIAIAAHVCAYRELLAARAARARRRGRASAAMPGRAPARDLNADTLPLRTAAPDTIDTMPEDAAFADHGETATMPEDGGDAEAVLARFAQAGIDVDALAARCRRGRRPRSHGELRSASR
jgi:transaldolase